MSDITRQIAAPTGKLAHLLDLAQKIYSQRTASKGKIYIPQLPEYWLWIIMLLHEFLDTTAIGIQRNKVLTVTP